MSKSFLAAQPVSNHPTACLKAFLQFYVFNIYKLHLSVLFTWSSDVHMIKYVQKQKVFLGVSHESFILVLTGEFISSHNNALVGRALQYAS